MLESSFAISDFTDFVPPNFALRTRAMEFNAVHQATRKCSVCSSPMLPSCEEPAKPGFVVQTYQCSWCHNIEQFVKEKSLVTSSKE